MRSTAGPGRSANQDSAAAGADFAVVADGVGGHAGGDVASAEVVRQVVDALAGAEVPDLDAEALRAAVAGANAALRRITGTDPALTGMATTFTGLFCGHGSVRVVHVGDSRAYRLHGSASERVTRDDSLVQRLVDAGAIGEEDAARHPHRHVILRSLAGGADDAAGISLQELPGLPGDRWLVCSDGLTDVLDDDEVLTLARDADGPDAAAGALLDAARAAGARDDVTVVVADVAGVPPADAGPRCLGAAGARAG